MSRLSFRPPDRTVFCSVVLIAHRKPLPLYIYICFKLQPWHAGNDLGTMQGCSKLVV